MNGNPTATTLAGSQITDPVAVKVTKGNLQPKGIAVAEGPQAVGLQFRPINLENPDLAHEARAGAGDHLGSTIAIDITNLGDKTSQFSIFVEIVGEPLRQVVRSATLTTDGVRPERSTRVTTRVPSAQQNVECVIVAVGGELPFGIDLGPVEPIRINAP